MAHVRRPAKGYKGAHRKVSSRTTIASGTAFVAIAGTTIGAAGVAGATAANNVATPDIRLAADETTIDPGSQEAAIAPVTDFKPVTDLDEQLQQSIATQKEYLQADKLTRVASFYRPATGEFTSGYGMRWGVLHAGIDIANSMNTPIYAVADGVVISAGAASGFGQWIRVQHEDGTITVYGHVETILVQVGQQVSGGEQIGGMGSRGFSTGVHLHFEVHPNGGAAIDPVPWLLERGIDVMQNGEVQDPTCFTPELCGAVQAAAAVANNINV